MKVSISWLQQLIKLDCSLEELANLIPLRVQGGIKSLTDDYIELDLKGYNRSDLLSLRGVAYEIAAITDSKVNFEEPEENQYVWVNKNLDTVKVEIQNPELCPLYCIAKIEGLKDQKSPKDWVKKLEQSGMRSVGSIADVTNLVMLEYGQPLHSFDAISVNEEKIVVRNAKSGEKIITLDEKTRELLPQDLLIADPEKAVGIAGVMGGKNSEIKAQTQTILLEAAIFDPINLRRTASRLALNSEASKRFQHGLTKKRLLQALDAAIKMYEELGGKLTAITITGTLEETEKKVPLRLEKLNSLVGIDFDPQFIEETLTKLNFKTTLASRAVSLRGWDTIPPYWRLDINIEEDLVEEIARMYGYENIPAKPLEDKYQTKSDQTLFNLIYSLKKTLADMGLTEIQTYSFYSTQVIENCKLEIENLLHIANPMSAETEYMRDQLWPNMVEKVVDNLKYLKDAAIFEIGKVYEAQKQSLPKEKYKLAIALSNESDNPLAELYALIQKALNQVEAVEFKPKDGLFHPNRFVTLKQKGGEIGFATEVHQRVVNRFGSEKRVAILEIELAPIIF